MDRQPVDPGPLVVSWIQTKEPLEDRERVLEALGAPQRDPITIEAAEEWPVVNQPPGKQTLEPIAKGLLANSYTDFVVSERGVEREGREHPIAEVGVGVQAPEILMQQRHQRGACFLVLAARALLDSLKDRVRLRVVGVGAGQYLLHLEDASRTRSELAPDFLERAGIRERLVFGSCPGSFFSQPQLTRLKARSSTRASRMSAVM